MAASSPSAAAAEFTKPGFAVSLLGALLPGLYLLITSTTTLVTTIWLYDLKRILEFALLMVLFLLPALNRGIRQEFGSLLTSTPRWLGLMLLAIAGWGALSAAVNARSAMHLANSLSEVALMASLVLGVFVIASCRRISGPTFDRLMVGLIALTALAVGAQELMGVLAFGLSGSVFSYAEALVHFAHPRFFNQFQSWTVPLLAAIPLLFAKYRLAYILALLALALQWYLILMTGARGSFVSLTTAVSFSFILFPILRRRLLIWQLTGLALGGLLYFLVLFSFEFGLQESAATISSQQSGPQASAAESGGYYGNELEIPNSFLAQSLGRPMGHSSGRTQMWRSVLSDSTKHPLLGIGPLNFSCTEQVWFGHPHNFAVQVLAEWGWPVALMVFVVVLSLYRKLVERIRFATLRTRDENIFAGLLLTGVLAASIHSLFSGLLVMPASQVTGLAICGTLLGLMPTATTYKTNLVAAYSTLIGIVLATSLLALGGYELRTMENRAAQFHPKRILAPRMWQDSKVCQLYAVRNEVSN